MMDRGNNIACLSAASHRISLENWHAPAWTSLFMGLQSSSDG